MGSTAPATDADLSAWRECRDCGLFQVMPSLPDGEAAICIRCSATLRRAAAYSVPFARVSAVISALLLALALNLPFVEMRIVGRFATSTLLTGPATLWNRGLPALAIVVLFTLIIMPAVKLALELAVLFGALLERPPRLLAWLFGWLEAISPWAMIEVFLLGAIVAYTRLRDLAHVDVGPGMVAIGGVMLSMMATDATLDHEAVWQELDKAPRLTRRAEPRSPLHPPSLLGCRECGRVAHAAVGDRCGLCSHRLFSRKRGGLSRVWALTIAAALLYIPANVLPVMIVQRMGRGGAKTILSGVIELAHDHLWPLAALVLLASIIVPIMKLVSIVTMLVMTHRRSSARLGGRTRLFRFIRVIGRWSMIDIFMLAVLVGVVRFGFLATIMPGLGAVAFCGVVLLTVVATEAFDPRLMWDAAGRQGDVPHPAEAS